ncbi:MAG: SpoIIE family protein phosphatase [Desulfobacter sp.]|nr:MAG: SpoIIE family protein phosphatase [Desulfobacter sp.]
MEGVAMAVIDCHTIFRAMTGIPTECGDMGIIRETETDCMACLVDALGHGKTAHGTACMAKDFLDGCRDEGPADIIKGLHRRLKGSRGAVAAACRLDKRSGKLVWSGMGNIDVRIYGPRPRRLVARDGVLGYMIPSPREEGISLHRGDILVMCSDGIRAHFEPLDYPDLFFGRAKDICRKFIRDLSKQDDDASCIVLRYGI